MDYVVLVDEKDNPVGKEEKMEAHRQGKLHRAFSIYVFNDQGKLLLQKRNSAKYHSGGMWANTCCSHPRPGERLLDAAHRRLKEEMGFDCELKELFCFVYKARFDNGLTEHEYDHVVMGTFNGSPVPNPDEVEGWKWVTLDELGGDVKSSPEKYAYWLKAALEQLPSHLRLQAGSGKAAKPDFFSYEHRAGIEKELKDFLPEKLTAEWAAKAVGKVRWEHDTEALTKAISKPVWDLLARGGKRWRPMLMLLCCEAVGGKADEILPFSVVPELIHNGTLIVDDIEDNSDLRRGKPALHKIFGIDIAVNAGNALYVLPFTAIRNSSLPVEIKVKAYQIISTQLIKCHFGQATDIYWHSGKSEGIPTEDQYFQMCEDKSGSLAGMAAQLGALLGGGTEKQVGALGKFAETAGVAFQIQDDILNIEGSIGIGKEFGDDISEGKRTLLVIYAFNKAPAAERKRLLEILCMHTKDEKLISEVIGVIKKCGAIGYAKKVAAGLVEEAWQGTEAVLPDSEAKNRLKEFAQMLIKRSV